MPFAGMVETPTTESIYGDNTTTDPANLSSVPQRASPQDAPRVNVRFIKSNEDYKRKVRRVEKKNAKLSKRIVTTIKLILSLDPHDTNFTPESISSSVSMDQSVDKPISKIPTGHSDREENIEAEVGRLSNTERAQSSKNEALMFNERPMPDVENTTHSFPKEKESTTHPGPKRCTPEENKGPSLIDTCLRQTVLDHVKNWNVLPGEIEKFIQVLEKYKTSAISISKEAFAFESTLKSLSSKISKSKSAQELVDPKNKGSSSVPGNSAEESEEHNKVWQQANTYMMGITPEVLEEFERLAYPDPLRKPCSEYILNLYAINRLAAILKMFKYCQDARIDILVFQKQLRCKGKCAVRSMKNWTKTESNAKLGDLFLQGSFYPIPSEYDYLRSLKIEQIEDELCSLRSTLLDCAEQGCNSAESAGQILSEANLETRIRALSTKTRALHDRVLDRVRAQKKQVRVNVPTGVSLKRLYEQIVPAMKRKRAKALREEDELFETGGCSTYQGQTLHSKTCKKGVPVSILEDEEDDIETSKLYDPRKHYEYGMCTCYSCWNDTHTTPSSVTATPAMQETAMQQCVEAAQFAVYQDNT